MDGVVGTLLLAAATLLFGWAMVEYRRPNPSRWTRAESPVLVIVFTTMSLLSFGVGTLARFLVPLGEARLGLSEATLIGITIMVTWIGVRALRARWKRTVSSDKAVIEAQSKVTVVPLERSGQSPDPGKRPPRSLGGGKRAGRRKAA